MNKLTPIYIKFKQKLNMTIIKKERLIILKDFKGIHSWKKYFFVI